MQLKLQVQPIDGDAYVVETNLFTIVALERRFKIRASDLANGIAMEHLAFLAYEAAKHSGVVVPAIFDDFIKKLQAVEVLDSDDVNPLEAEVIPTR